MVDYIHWEYNIDTKKKGTKDNDHKRKSTGISTSSQDI